LELTQVFISYAHEDIDYARKLYEKLKSVPSIEPWFDKKCLLPGVRWKPAIRKAIRESRFFIALLSNHSVTKKGFVQKELNDALEILDEFPENQVFLIPARLEECALPSEKLREIQYVDFFPDWNEGFETMLKTLTAVHSDEKGKWDALGENGYRCGIVDLDAGLTNTPKIAHKLNKIQKFFHFTCPSLPLLSKDAIR
jgi:hypothetical protein